MKNNVGKFKIFELLLKAYVILTVIGKYINILQQYIDIANINIANPIDLYLAYDQAMRLFLRQENFEKSIERRFKKGFKSNIFNGDQTGTELTSGHFEIADFEI